MGSINHFCLYSDRVVTPRETRPAFLEVMNGKIHKISSTPPDRTDGIPVEDLSGLVLMPGVVETHAHLNEPGRTEWEGFETATRAALSGGITTIIDMPLNCIPATTSFEALSVKRASVSKHASTDFGFWGGVVPGNLTELNRMMDSGICGFKAFLIDSGVSEFPSVTESDLRPAMRMLAKRRVPLLVHAELESKIETTPRSGKYSDYLQSRPEKWEIDAIQLMIRLCRETMCPVHIVHLSCAAALSDIKNAKSQGLPITVETCPHYLVFTSENIPENDTSFKCAPPIREKKNSDLLWNGLLTNVIDCVVSDHSPCTPALKEKKDFFEAWGGVSGLQFGARAVWTEGKKRGLTLGQLARAMCLNTALLAGLSNKGALLPGFDADIVAWDEAASFTVTQTMVRHRHRLSPFIGTSLMGSIEKTWLRGHCVYDQGVVVESMGREIFRGQGT